MTEFSRPRKRFIAGAVCPRCAAMDKIAVDLESDLRECVACGFSEERPTAGGQPLKGSSSPSPAEPVTRVSRPAARRVETPAEPVTLMDSASLRKPDAT